ncbi:hypothetical protein ADK17_22390 [Bacillus anthracis]|nr:hypothetical protein ADK17_22390 [Bacillus anthracis]
MRPLQISPDTAVRLSKALGVPLEQLMHMPQHILIQKLVELEKQNKDEAKEYSPVSQDFLYFLLYHG